jgi:hypothetical protein
VLEATERFLDVEREDKRELEELSKILKPVRDTTLWYLLVKLMAMARRRLLAWHPEALAPASV